MWKLAISSGNTKSMVFHQTYSSEDWKKAEAASPRKYGEGMYAHRLRAWTSYVGKHVVDFEWE
jgi:hypothetical protein